MEGGQIGRRWVLPGQSLMASQTPYLMGRGPLQLWAQDRDPSCPDLRAVTGSKRLGWGHMTVTELEHWNKETWAPP